MKALFGWEIKGTDIPIRKLRNYLLIVQQAMNDWKPEQEIWCVGSGGKRANKTF